MIYAVCGPLSPHQMVVTHLAKAVLERRYDRVLFCATNDPRELRNMVASRNGAACLLVFDTPGEIIANLIVKGGMPTALVVEPFHELVAFAWNYFGGLFEDGYRATTKSLAALHPVASISNVAPLRVADTDDSASVINRICVCFDVYCHEDEVSTIIRAFQEYYQTSNVLDIAQGISHHSKAARHTTKNYTAEQKIVLRKLANAYEVMLRPQRIAVISWPVETLTNAETGSPVSGPIELTGPGRLLTFGPYLYLPKGRWKVSIIFSTANNVSGNIFMLDIFSPTTQAVLAVGHLTLPVSGTFSTSLLIEVESALNALELRTFMPTGAIEGVLELVEISWQLI